jgi:predicted DNA-binding protein with PD1-like motif
MRHRTLASNDGQRTIVAVFDPGDEAVEGLGALAAEERLSAASFTAVGAFERATVGWYDLDGQEYREIPVDEQAEVLSILGDVARGKDGSPAVHAHAVLGLPDGSTRGGHLLKGTVRPTLEVVIRETPAELHKTFRPEFGLALIDLGSGT